MGTVIATETSLERSYIMGRSQQEKKQIAIEKEQARAHLKELAARQAAIAADKAAIAADKAADEAAEVLRKQTDDEAVTQRKKNRV